MTDALKPCPFCGGAASTWHTDAYSCDSSEYVLGCQECDIYTPYDSVFGKSELPTSFIALWNTRADLSQWHPIETAKEKLTPGDSATVFAHNVITTALFVGSMWMSRGEEITPTHWMPLPTPPEAK